MHKLSHTLKVLLALGMLLISNNLFAIVTAKVDRQYAYEGETVTLSIKAENEPNATEPDFSPLIENFNIGSTSQGSSISIINGRSSSSRTWSVRLQPKKLGVIEIPSLSIGQEKTEPFTIEIKPIPVQSGNHQGQPLFLTFEIDSKATRFYVQQHIPLVVRLYYKHEISQGHITDPAPENAVIERLGDDVNYSTKYNGQDYRVFERRYSVLAEKSGDLHIPSVSFQGNMVKPQAQQGGQRRYDPFSQFFSTPLVSQGQPVSIKSQPIDVNIEPHPSAFNGQQWLPAESIVLHDSWSDNPPSFKVGEPVSRTITLEAKGLVASQIKPIELPAVSSFRRYAEPAETQTRTDGQNVYATSRRNFTYIPAYDGDQEIPALELPWWNVITQKQETARLPAWKVIVEKGLNNSTPPPPVTSKPQPDQPAPSQNDDEVDQASDSVSLWQKLKALITEFAYWIAGLLILVFAVLIVLNNRNRHGSVRTQNMASGQRQATSSTNPVIATEKPLQTTGSKELLAKFHDACQANDARQVSRLLLEMAQQAWPENPPRSIGALAETVEEGKQALQSLDRYLYSGSQESWNGQDVCEAFKSGLTVKHDQPKQEPALKPLYPQ